MSGLGEYCATCKHPSSYHALHCANHPKPYPWTNEEVKATRCGICGKYYGGHDLNCSSLTMEALVWYLLQERERTAQLQRYGKHIAKLCSDLQTKLAQVKQENNQLRRKVTRQARAGKEGE